MTVARAGQSTLEAVKIALIANAGSGGSTDPDEVAAALTAQGARVQVFAIDECDRAEVRESGAERIVVCGGDGSIGFAAEIAAALDVPLAVIPAGTANDFARTQDIPLDDIPRACVLAACGTQLKRLDLGRLSNGSPFVNGANTGLSSHAARDAAVLKSALGPVAYGVGAARAAVKADPLRCKVTIDGREVFSDRTWQVLIAVTGGFGGGSGLFSADPQDGLLDVAVVPAGSRFGLARRAWGMRRGNLADQQDVIHSRGREILLELPPGTELNVDGEVIEAGRPERAVIEPGAFALVVG